MKLLRVSVVLFVAALLFAGVAMACASFGPLAQRQPTPLPTAAVVVRPTVTPFPTVVLPTEPPAVDSSQEPDPARDQAPASGQQPADPHLVVIKESDIAAMVANGAGASQGVQTDGLAVRFTGGKTVITAREVKYSLIDIQNLNLVGRLVARDGALQMDTESVSPAGLVTNMLPQLINQAFKQYASQWYVEDVQTYDGYIQLRVR